MVDQTPLLIPALVRDEEVASSNLVIPTSDFQGLEEQAW